MMTSQLLRTLRARGAGVCAAGLLVVALTACTGPVVTSQAPSPDAAPTGTPTAPGTAAGGAVTGSGAAGTTGVDGTGTGGTTGGLAPVPSPDATDARWYDLMHVQQTAAPCLSVWNVGAVLPPDYQWCADADGHPVAGVRVGPCEVVSYGRTMYAIPGRSIRSVTGAIDRDQAYLGLLTSCKRKPFPPESR